MTIARAHKDAGVLRWSSSVVLALALHVLAIALLLGSDGAEELSDSPPTPIVLDLTALPVEAEIMPDETMAATADASQAPATAEARRTVPWNRSGSAIPMSLVRRRRRR